VDELGIFESSKQNCLYLRTIKMLVTQGDEDQLSHEDQLSRLRGCTHPYIPIDVQRTRYLEGNPNPFQVSPLSTVVLRHVIILMERLILW